jgi:hypothetical protein
MAKVTKATAGTLDTSSKNSKGAAFENSPHEKGVIEVHVGLGWKTAFGLHLENKNKQKTWENYKMSPGIYLHPQTRPGKFQLAQKLLLWITPYTVWSKNGPSGFIFKNAAVDFYYKISTKLEGNERASICRSGWFVTPE